MLALKTPNLVKDIEDLKEHFDTSNYPTDHPLYSNERANHLFLVKDEAKGSAITRFIGLRSKQYCFQIEKKDGSKVVKKCCKGIKKTTIAKHLTMQNYLDSIEKEQVIYKSATQIRAFNHQLSTIIVRKIATCAMDDKRYLHDDKISTSALHYHKNDEI